MGCKRPKVQILPFRPIVDFDMFLANEVVGRQNQ
jgi:hypothetical protein